MKNPRFKKVVSADRISLTVRKMARQIDLYYAARSVPEIAMVCVMNASFMFCADLVRCLKTPARIVFTRARSYQGARKGKTTIAPISEALGGCHVLVADTIYDTGETIQKVVGEVRKQTSKIAVAVLIAKTGKSPGPLPKEVKFVGIQLPGDPFLVGYGLDYNQRYRDLKDLRVFDARLD